VSTDIDPRQIEEARRQINRLAEEIAQLSEMELAPAEYYDGFLQRLLTAIAAPAGAVWVRTPQGNLQLQYQIRMSEVGLDRFPNSRQMHNELLRQVTMSGQPRMAPPQSSMGETEGNQVPPGNPTDYVILLAPIIYDKQVTGIVEVWQDPARGQDAMRGFLQFMMKMAGLAAGYTRNHQLRQMVGQQQVWVQLETFARQVHGTLNPTEVAYLIANEGRRLVEADRVSVALKQGFHPQVLAISGADVIEKRSNLVQLMRSLFETVMDWGEKLVYSGTKDDALPPKVLKALDLYLAESNSKFLVVMPLADERETSKKRKARSAVMMESFETGADPEQKTARLEVIGRHATTALYNAAEYKRIPMRFLWLPLAKVQDGLGGKAQAILYLVLTALTVLTAMMIFMPYPLKMDAVGRLEPEKYAMVYAQVPGQVKAIPPRLTNGSRVAADEELILLYDQELDREITALQGEIDAARDFVTNLRGKTTTQEERTQLQAQESVVFNKTTQLQRLRERYNADVRPGHAGFFWIKAPMGGVILSPDFRTALENRPVKPNEPLLRIGAADLQNRKLAEWRVKLNIPQKHIGQVYGAFKTNDPAEELDVDLLVRSEPTNRYKGKLRRDKIGLQAENQRDANDEPEPVVVAWARVHGTDIPEEYRIPTRLILSDVEITSRIRCGDRAMGYSLFYGVWEFFYEKVLFFF
jgi:hypothetical protein